jgi:hypothetical protein
MIMQNTRFDGRTTFIVIGAVVLQFVLIFARIDFGWAQVSQREIPIPGNPQNPKSRTAPPAEGYQTLVLPPMVGPELPLAAPALKLPQLSSAFVGCWEGEPEDFDSEGADPGLFRVGSPGRMVFCYSQNYIGVPEFDLRIRPAARAVDLALHLGLGFSTLKAHGIHTDVYSVSASRIHARTKLLLLVTEHWLYLIPRRTEQPGIVDWFATLTAPDSLLLQARELFFADGHRAWGTLHGEFHRIPQRVDVH